MDTPFPINYLRRLLLLLPLFLIIISVIFLFCKYRWYHETTNEYLWGIIKDTDRVFNQKMFLILSGISLVLYLGMAFVPWIPVEKTLFTRGFQWGILVLAIAFYFTGLFSPLYETEKLKIFGDEVSLWESVGLLFDYEEYYLGILVFTFTVLFPVAKFVSLILEFMVPDFSNSALFRIFYSIGKFSMLDVFIVAVFLLNMRFGSVFVSMKLQEGIVFFSVSVILSLVLFGAKRRKFIYESI